MQQNNYCKETRQIWIEFNNISQQNKYMSIILRVLFCHCWIFRRELATSNNCIMILHKVYLHFVDFRLYIEKVTCFTFIGIVPTACSMHTKRTEKDYVKIFSLNILFYSNSSRSFHNRWLRLKMKKIIEVKHFLQ